MAALYRALEDTLLTPSQLSNLDYDAMKDFVIASLHNQTGDSLKSATDKVLLENFELAVCGVGPWEYHGALGAEVEVVEDQPDQLVRRRHGSRLGYSCGLGRRFLDPETEDTYDQR